MSYRKMRAGSTSVIAPFFVYDTSSTTGGGLGSLAYNTSGLAAKYRREGDASWTTITLVAATPGTWTSGGFVADGGPVAGGYELGVPNAALAAGAKWVEIVLYGAANMDSVKIFIELDAVDYQDSVRFGLSALPNAAAGSSNGLPTVDSANAVKVQSGTGAGQIDLSGGAVRLQSVDALVVHSGAAQAGGSASITLAAGASSTNDLHVGNLVKIYSGTGAGQTRVITAYNGSTKVATVARAWAVAPDNTSLYAILAIQSPALDASLAVAVQNGGAGLTSIGDARLANLDAAISSRLAASSYTAPPSTSAIAAAIWQDLLSGSDFSASGSVGKLLKDNIDAAISSRLASGSYSTPPSAAAIATQIFTDLLSGSDFNTAGSFGKLIKDYLDVAVSTRLASGSYSPPPTTGQIATAIMTDLLSSSDFDTAGSFGKLIKDYLDAAISSRLASSSYTAPDNATISSIKTDTSTLLSRITSTLFSGITSLADWLRRMVRKDVGTSGMIAAMSEINAGGTATFDGATDSLEALKDQLPAAIDSALTASHGSGSWTTGSGGGGVTITEGDINAIADEVESRFQGGDIVVTSPVGEDGSVVTLVSGASYDANTRRLIWSNSEGSWPKPGGDLTGATVSLIFDSEESASMPPIVGEIVAASGANQSVAFDLTENQTLALSRGTWRFAIWAVKSGPGGYTWMLSSGEFDIHSVPRLPS